MHATGMARSSWVGMGFEEDELGLDRGFGEDEWWLSNSGGKLGGIRMGVGEIWEM
jgi:hypothetical protein